MTHWLIDERTAEAETAEYRIEKDEILHKDSINDLSEL